MTEADDPVAEIAHRLVLGAVAEAAVGVVVVRTVDVDHGAGVVVDEVGAGTRGLEVHLGPVGKAVPAGPEQVEEGRFERRVDCGVEVGRAGPAGGEHGVAQRAQHRDRQGPVKQLVIGLVAV